MAIATSSDYYSFPCKTCNRQNHFNISSSSSGKHLLFSSFPCTNFQSLVSSSSASSSQQTLQDALSTDAYDPKSFDFEGFPDAGTADLNRVLRKLLQNPQSEELALEFYEKAKENPEFKPEKSTMILLIRYLTNLGEWDSISLVSDDLRKYNALPDKLTCSSLVARCIKARKFRIADSLLHVFVSDSEIFVLASAVAMKSYNKLHMYNSTIGVYKRMETSQIALDSACYCHLMEAFMKIGDTDGVLTFFEEIERKQLVISKPYSSKIYGILCESLGASGRAIEALGFFRDMEKKGIPAEPSIYTSLISAFAKIRDVKIAEQLFTEAEGKRMLRDPEVFLKIVLMYIEEGLLENTLEVIKVMKCAKIGVSDCIFCAVVNGYSKKRGFQSAINIFDELMSLGCEPGQVTYASMINAYCRIGLYSEAEQLFSVMEEKGYDKCVVAYSSMIVMYGKTGRIKDAMRLLAKMKERKCKPNVWIYNSLMDMHGKVKNLRQVEKLWNEMKRRKITPDKVSYTCVISAYSKAREFESCVRLYQEFRINGGLLDKALAGMMVGVFSKIDRVDELVRLLQDIKSEGTRLDGRLYWSALNALRDAGLQIQAEWLQESFAMAESKA